ncbi:MAG: DUF58 domain-containing protein, partial [Sphingobacteriales bacterium]
MKLLNRYIISLFFSSRFYWTLGAIACLFGISFLIAPLFTITKFLLAIFVLLVLLDYAILFFSSSRVTAERIVPERFSNGDENIVKLELKNEFPFRAQIKIIDELPDQFQQRKFLLRSEISGNGALTLPYSLRPVERGEYQFHKTHVFVKTPLGFVVRRCSADNEAMVKVMPSFVHLRNFELLAYSNNLAEAGSRKIRKIGH